MSKSRFLGLLLVTGALSGCASMAQVPLAGVALAPSYDGAKARPAPAPRRWWALFGNRTLTKLVDSADIGNLDIAAANARIGQANAQARITGASLFPFLNASGDGARAQSSGTMSRLAGVTSPSVSNSFSGVLAASYEVDLWGANRDLLSGARANASGAVYAREVIRLATRAGVANAWFALVAARDRLGLAQENLRNARRILDVIKLRLTVGTGNALEVAQQESLIASQLAAIPDLRQSAELSRTTLALLMGRPPERLAIASPGIRAIKVPGVAPGLPAQLLTRRPDIRQAESALEAASANLSAARKAMLPQISLTGQAGLRSAALSNLLRPESAIWSLAAGLVQPIFDGGSLSAQRDLAQAQQRELLENYRKTIVSALVDVENALTVVRQSAAREAAQGVVVSRAREAFKLSEERLRLGTIDLTTLLTTQNTLFQAQDALVQARLFRLQAAVSLFQAIGGDFVLEPLPAPPELTPTLPLVSALSPAAPTP